MRTVVCVRVYVRLCVLEAYSILFMHLSYFTKDRDDVTTITTVTVRSCLSVCLCVWPALKT